jgi:class 3 adenylate cyclase
MFDAIASHGGIVSLMIGDGLMVIFGAPVPQPDHAASAVRAAREMIETIALFNVERQAAAKPAIAIGIGIASGAMVAGFAGTNERATYTCVGDTVNVAARLEAHTKVAGRPILVDAATRAALGDDTAMEALGPVEVKGKTTPVEVFAVPVPR